MTTKKLARFFFGIIALFFFLIGIKQIQDHFVGYGFISFAIATGILLLTFQSLIRNRFNK
jgi:hypothetical protein